MKKIQYAKLIVPLVIILNIVFAASVLWVFKQAGSEPTVLIGSWFAFTTGELWMLKDIKKAKIKKEDK